MHNKLLLLKDRPNLILSHKIYNTVVSLSSKYIILLFLYLQKYKFCCCITCTVAVGQNVGQRQSPKEPPAWWTEGE